MAVNGGQEKLIVDNNSGWWPTVVVVVVVNGSYNGEWWWMMVNGNVLRSKYINGMVCKIVFLYHQNIFILWECKISTSPIRIF